MNPKDLETFAHEAAKHLTTEKDLREFTQINKAIKLPKSGSYSQPMILRRNSFIWRFTMQQKNGSCLFEIEELH